MGLALWGGSPGLSGIGAVTPGTTPIVGGTNKRVLFDDNGVVGESSGFTFDKASAMLTTTGIITANGGFNISNISLINIFSIADTAWITRPGTTSTVALAPGGYWQRTDLYSNNAIQASVLSGSFSIGSGADVLLSRDAANTLALRNGSSAQASRVYNTYTDASNGEWASIRWSANRLLIGTEANGTGAVNAIDFQANTYTFKSNGGTALFYILNSGTLQAATDGGPDIGVAATGRFKDAYLSGKITVGSTTLITSTTAFTNGAAAAAGTLLNAPVAGNPTKWIPISDNGTTRYIPAW